MMQMMMEIDDFFSNCLFCLRQTSVSLSVPVTSPYKDCFCTVRYVRGRTSGSRVQWQLHVATHRRTLLLPSYVLLFSSLFVSFLLFLLFPLWDSSVGSHRQTDAASSWFVSVLLLRFRCGTPFLLRFLCGNLFFFFGFFCGTFSFLRFHNDLGSCFQVRIGSSTQEFWNGLTTAFAFQRFIWNRTQECVYQRTMQRVEKLTQSSKRGTRIP